MCHPVYITDLCSDVTNVKIKEPIQKSRVSSDTNDFSLEAIYRELWFIWVEKIQERTPAISGMHSNEMLTLYHEYAAIDSYL